jgi:serine/threonine-protein kinase PRP4
MSSSSNVRPNKRPRVETVDTNDHEEKHQQPVDEEEGIDEETLLLQMTGGAMHNEDEDSRRGERERKRRERQQRIQQQTQAQPSMTVVKEEKGTSTAVVKEEEGTSMVVVKEEEGTTVESPAAEFLPQKDNRDDSPAPKVDDDDDDFDMFSSSVSPVAAKTRTTTTATATTTKKTDDFQDAEGYYKAVIGETLDLANESFKVLGVVGKGVFSTVLKCSVESSETTLPSTVALKFIRHNETMSRAAENEVAFLKKLSHPHIVKLELPTTQQLLEHRGHVIMVFPYLPFNLRDVLQKFGKGVGLSLQAVKSYFLQLLSALQHLEKYNIIHADIKPDNMLVSEDFGTVKLCDFGSAMENGSADAVPTPYLVSRFYRAPEIILGAVPTPALDLWSVGVTVAELFLGRLLFQGKSNNDMLRTFMESMGPFSAKTLRQHLVQVNKLGIPAHFLQRQQNFIYLQETLQILNDKHVVKEIQLQTFPTTPLQQRLLKAKSSKDPRLDVQQFGALLQRTMCLEATRRISVEDATKHEFFVTK